MNESSHMNLETPPVCSAKTSGSASRGSNTNGIVGVCFSALGLAGWLTTLSLIFWIEKEKTNSFLDLFDYLMQVFTGLFGFGICTCLSLVGTIVSGIGLPHEPKRVAFAGFGIGITGLLTGLGIYLWRMMAWGLIS